MDLRGDFHMISTFLVFLIVLAIDFLLDFFDLVSEGKIQAEIGLDFFDAVHDGGVVLYANFGRDFSGAHGEFFT